MKLVEPKLYETRRVKMAFTCDAFSDSKVDLGKTNVVIWPRTLTVREEISKKKEP